MKVVLCILTIILTVGAQAATLPGDAAEGKRLHLANCTGCHDTAVYARKNHSVQLLDGLKQQFESCSHMAKKEFTPSEAQNILKYLNVGFYHFQ